MDWFEAFCKKRDSLTMKVDGKDVPVNDCMHCTKYANGSFSSCCEACSAAVLDGVMNMTWEANDETLEEMRRFREEYESKHK